MKKYISRLLLLFVFFISGCDFDSFWRDPPYEVIRIDNSVTLAYNIGNDSYIGRVGAMVVAVGSNDQYITVQRCDKDQCSYYYIDKAIDHIQAAPKFAVKGPLTVEEFKREQAYKKLPKLIKLK